MRIGYLKRCGQGWGGRYSVNGVRGRFPLASFRFGFSPALKRYYNSPSKEQKILKFREEVQKGPSLFDFIHSNSNFSDSNSHPSNCNSNSNSNSISISNSISNANEDLESIASAEDGVQRQAKTVFVESYGCQMNFSDTEIVLSIMKEAGFVVTTDALAADVVFLNTCAIREKAESKIWQRLMELKHLKAKRKKTKPLTVGVLGCMAERLKEQLLDKDKMVDLVAGPDAYRDIPRLLNTVHTTAAQAINVALSVDETYAEITPIRYAGVSAFVSIMRGCNNMCTYCIVPFTRGRERSRPADSIVAEIEELSRSGVKEVVLLGQNVNSYNDLSGVADTAGLGLAPIAEGFETVYKRPKVGVSFTELVDRISRVDPEMRIRFTSPHPKDFPEELIRLIKERVNVCKSIHIPAQSGSTACLSRMRRGYSREAYVNLIRNIREVIPDITLSSDFISGFCGETEEEHLETLSLLEEIRFDTAYMFAYSMREKTPAHRKFQDDVPEEIKKRRLQEVIDTFHKIVFQKNKEEIGKIHLVLVEGTSRKSNTELKGRADNNKKVIIPDVPAIDLRAPPALQPQYKNILPGDYVAVEIVQSTGLALKGRPIALTTQEGFWRERKARDSEV